MKWWNYRLRYITIQKIRIIYSNGYKHDMWVYDLVEDKDGSYSWECFEDDNKIIDITPDNITSIFVIKKRRVWNWYEKAGTVLDSFKPKPKDTEAKLDRDSFAPYRKYYDKASVKDEIQIIVKDLHKPFVPEFEVNEKIKAFDNVNIVMSFPDDVESLRKEIRDLERKIAKLKGRE